MAHYAVIDVGTNSVKFHVGEKRADGSWRKLVDRAEVTRLGEGLEAAGGEFTQAAMERTSAAIAGMADEAKRHDVVTLAAVGTMGLRIARNSGAFIAEVRRRCGVVIEVIPGAEEGRLAYLAVKAGLGLATGTMVIFDTGGGSTQFTFGRGTAVEEQFSLNVGAVRFTEQFGLGGEVTSETVACAQDAIAAEFDRLHGHPAPEALVGMGGAVTNLTAVQHGLVPYDPDVVQGSILTVTELERQIEIYRTRTTEARRQIPGLQPKRADVILAGACVVRVVMRKLGKDALTVSDRGLRHGLLIDRFG